MAEACLSQCGGETASGLTKEIGKFFWGHLMSRVGYMVCYEKNVDKLKKTFEDLKDKENDIKRKTEEAKRKGEVVYDVVTTWLRKVHELDGEVSQMSEEVVENRRCFNGCFPDLAWRYKIGKEANKRLFDVEDLQKEGNFETVSQLPPPPGIESLPMGDFMAFSSTIDAMNKVLEAMRNEKQQLIGIYGMGGVGKTTLMEELGRQFSRDKEFGTVVKVVVSQNPNIAQIRRDIADGLGMRLWGDGETAAGALATRLKDETKIVIMMDDVWARLDLRTIGIPTGDEHKGCKVLFTTRTLDACNQMESHASILVDVLTKEDSWTLFESKVGDVCNSADIKPIAKKVADECGGLPLAIVVVGRALRGCNKTSVWDNSLMQLKRSIPNELPNVEEQLFKSLELSYNYIRNVEMKLLFLFCCLFREDYTISEDELTRYAVGEGFLTDAYTMDDGRRKVHLLVEGLIACCLLLSTDRECFVKMHDVVRDVAVYIASKGDDCFFVKAGLGMRDWPESRIFEVCKRISLMSNDIGTLPDQPNCPKLLTLLLSFNLSLSGIPKNFFLGMASLTVLDLSDTGIASLPSSLACLTNLGSLRLDRCKNLRDVSLIGRLKKLKVLGLQRCAVNVLPEEIGNLTNLRLLDLSYSKSLTIPPNLICKLSWLEELFMIDCDLKETLLFQVGSLKRLSRLQVRISNVELFSQDVEALDGWKNLSKFIIYVESDWYSRATKYEKNLYLKNLSKAGNWTRILLIKSDDLILDGCNWDLTRDNLVNVKKLQLTNCSHVDSLVSTAQQTSSPNVFANLEKLVLANLANLKEICQAVVSAPSFNRLQYIEIVRCNKLTCIIPCNLLQRAHCTLQFLTVNSCDEVCEIFNSEGLHEEIPLLPELERLHLSSLPKLTRLWSGVLPAGSLQKLSHLQISGGSNKLECLFSELLSPGTFANLKELDIGGCPCLKYLMLPIFAQELRNLEKLTVKKNRSMEVIIGAKDGVLLDKGVFPRLNVIVLIDLPMLESFYRGEPTISFDWPSLEYINLESCPNMKRLPLGHASAPKLKKIHVGDDDDVEWLRGLEWEDASTSSRFEICKNR